MLIRMDAGFTSIYKSEEILYIFRNERHLSGIFLSLKKYVDSIKARHTIF